MKLDLVILAVIALAAVLGALAGAARQVAQWVALGVACYVAGPLGRMVGPRAAVSLHLPPLTAVVATTVAAFLLVMILARFILTGILRSVLAGRKAERAGLDRALGFVLGGLKATVIVYVILSALSFVEDHLDVAGRKLGLSPKGSTAFALVREHNLFELTEFSAVRDLLRVARATRNPEKLQRMKRDPAFRALQQDGRFREILEKPSLRRALNEGDATTLLRNNTVLQLVEDKQAAGNLGAAADSAQP